MLAYEARPLHGSTPIVIVLVGLFIVLVGLVIVLVGLFIVLVGLFIVLVGLFIYIYRCWHTMHVPSMDQPQAVRTLAVTAMSGAGGGGFILACGLENSSIQIWDCLTWACISSTTLSGTPTSLLWRVGGVPVCVRVWGGGGRG